jgi:AraC-like DNA-binding protein
MVFCIRNADIYEKISLLEMAEMAGYSPFYFSKLFSEIMGIPITGYIRIRKLQYALGSLLEGRKVLDVSLMYAFDSHEGFTRSFTKLFGSTPSKVKKYLTSYKVPEYCVPNIEGRRMRMGADKESLIDNMHQIVYEVIYFLSQPFHNPFCTSIRIITLSFHDLYPKASYLLPCSCTSIMPLDALLHF